MLGASTERSRTPRGKAVSDPGGETAVLGKLRIRAPRQSTDSAVTREIFKFSRQTDGTICITEYNGFGGEVAIPREIDGQKVTRIGERAFAFRPNLTRVIVPDSVTSIGCSAFADCTGLVSAVMGKGVKRISDGAFLRCRDLEKVLFQSDVPPELGDAVFSGCPKAKFFRPAESVNWPKRLDRLSFKLFGGTIVLANPER